MSRILFHHLIALGLIGVTTLSLAIFIFCMQPKRFLNRLFALYMCSIAWWSLVEASTQFASTVNQAATLFRVEYVGICFIPTLFFHGMSHFAGLTKLRETAMYYALSVVFMLCISVLNLQLFIRQFSHVLYLRYWPVAGPLYGCFVGFFAIAILRTHWLLWARSCVERSSLRRAQLRALFFASLLAYLGGFPEFILKYGIQLPVIHPYGLVLLPLHVVVIAYAILQFRLFGIQVVVRRSLVYSILVTLLTVSYFGSIYILERLFQTQLGYSSPGISVLAFALMALLFQPLRIAVQRLVDWLFFGTAREDLVHRMERLEAEARQTEKLKAIATLAAGMAHEIKNPLASIKTFAEYLPERYDDPAFRDKFSRIVTQEVEKMNSLLHQLLNFAKPSISRRQLVRLSRIIDDTIELLQQELVRKQIEVARAYTQADDVFVDAGQLKQVLLNVLLNAIEAMDRGNGCITVSTVSEAGELHVVIADTGPGIASKDISRVFDPFFTTKPSGTGLGLSVVHGIVREHGGRVAIESAVGRGTTLRIILPSQPSPWMEPKLGVVMSKAEAS